MAGDDDPVFVHLRRRHEVIHRTLNPHAHAAMVPQSSCGIEPTEIRLDAPVVGSIRIDVAVVKRSQSVTAFDQIFDAPDIHPGAATGLGGPVVHNSCAPFRHPVCGQIYCRISQQRVVAKIIQAENDRRRPRPVIGKDQHQVNRRQLRRSKVTVTSCNVALPPSAARSSRSSLLVTVLGRGGRAPYM